jgi:hypothetical protein
MNFKWNSEKATLLLIIPKPDIDQAVVSYAAKNGYVEKPEIHLTLLSFQNGKKILQAISPENRAIILEKIFALAQSYEWNVRFVQEYFELERTIKEFVLHGRLETPEHMRRTIIQKVIADDLAVFLNRISENLGIFFEKPFPHVTLFSWSDQESLMAEGIGLNSDADFEKYKKQEIAL